MKKFNFSESLKKGWEEAPFLVLGLIFAACLALQWIWFLVWTLIHMFPFGVLLLVLTLAGLMTLCFFIHEQHD